MASQEPNLNRCPWVGSDPLMVAYHDAEWSVPVHDDRELFERLLLEVVQAGLAWSTILRKRDAFRRAFDGFDPARVAAYGQADVERLLADPGIVRNRLKVEGAIANARAFLKLQESGPGLAKHMWSFVGGKPIVHKFKTTSEVPATNAESDAMSKDLKKRGFKFVGSTILYAHMQATGMVNDHLMSCFRYKQCKQ